MCAKTSRRLVIDASVARAAGIINGLGSIGAVLQGRLTSEVSTRFGWGALFGVFVVLATVSALVLAWPGRRTVTRGSTAAAPVP